MRRIKLILAVAAAMAVMVLAAAPAMADGIHDSGNNLRFHNLGGNSFTVFFTSSNSDLGDIDFSPASFTITGLNFDLD